MQEESQINRIYQRKKISQKNWDRRRCNLQILWTEEGNQLNHALMNYDSVKEQGAEVFSRLVLEAITELDPSLMNSDEVQTYQS